MEPFKGILAFYINVYPELGQDMESTLLMIKEMNKPLMNQLDADGRYICLFIPTTKEATRIEKIDYDSPFPRYTSQNIEVENKKKKSSEENEPHFKGIITVYINFYPELMLDIAKVINIVRTVNSDTFKKVAEDGRYQIMIIPTTKEANRIEKIDYDGPFPRFVPKSVKNTLTPLIPKDEELDEEDDEE